MHGSTQSLRMGHRGATAGIRRWSATAALRWRVVAALELLGRAAPLLGGRGAAAATRTARERDRAA